MPNNRDTAAPRTDTQKEAPNLKINLRTLAASAALSVPIGTRPALKEPAAAAPPNHAREEKAAEDAVAWKPPGVVANIHQTHAALRRAAPSIAATGVRASPDLAAYLNDPAAMERDQLAVQRGQRHLQAQRAVAATRPEPQTEQRPRHQEVAAAPQPRPSGTDLIVQNRAVAQPLPVVPTWHDVKTLPGYQRTETRRSSREAFLESRNSELEDLFMICDLLNPPEHVQAVARWVAANAQQVDRSHFDFNRSFPGFTADFLVFKDAKSTFVITTDVGGHYIYIRPGGLQPAPEIRTDLTPALEPTSRRRASLNGPGV